MAEKQAKKATKTSKKTAKTKKITTLELIEKEKERLDDIYKTLPEKKYLTALKLIDNVAFMSVTLEKLMEEINKTKLIVKTKNASQEFLKESPALASYNKMYSNFLKGIQQLNSLLPSEPGSPTFPGANPQPDDFETFIQNRKNR